MFVTIPAHQFEAAKRATATGVVDDPRCGTYHPVGDEGEGVFCAEPASHPVHAGVDQTVNLVEH